jgi:hypothetical protein
MIAADPKWAEMLRDDQGNLPAVLLDSRSSRLLIDGLLRTPGWRLVFADQAAAVFLSEQVAAASQLPAVSHEPLKTPPKP